MMQNVTQSITVTMSVAYNWEDVCCVSNYKRISFMWTINVCVRVCG